MSLKPPKKSDLDKSWMKARRDKPKKIQPEYHLIITEGTETEPAYFGAMKDIINSAYPDRIQLSIYGAGDSTLNLFQKAKQLVLASANGYKHVWIVYDTDDFPAEHINKTAELCVSESTEETTYHAIWSNQCIELWFLLHFSYMQSDLHRSSYWPKLTEILSAQALGAYEKNRADMYQILFPYMNAAIANAKKLDKINNGKLPSASAPGTKVHVLVEKLKPYLIEVT
ncbi:MAG: RloB family protein [Lachnospiraceae bacterium]|nr:RloB family protein [Lachnospiraceae bacterium]